MARMLHSGVRVLLHKHIKHNVTACGKNASTDPHFPTKVNSFCSKTVNYIIKILNMLKVSCVKRHL